MKSVDEDFYEDPSNAFKPFLNLVNNFFNELKQLRDEIKEIKTSHEEYKKNVLELLNESKAEHDKLISLNDEKLNVLTEKYEKITGLTENYKEIIERLDEKVETNIVQLLEKKLSNVMDELKVKFLDIKNELFDSLKKQYDDIHEEMEKLIDMTAALTVEFSSKLESYEEKINTLDEKVSKREEVIQELKKEVISAIDKSSTIFESRLDGLKKQFEEEVISRLSMLDKIKSSINNLSKELPKSKTTKSNIEPQVDEKVEIS
ncbi:MAG: hypothetical protein ACTSYQ_00010 [Candidatus Odinarchaeia archaeon]